ncbi:MAG: NAD-dependent dehydratase [Legionella sp.]|nr:MAG: NAD-dependent dehydratase [Legionella sp.]PJD97381.1 MAG: NAD-dependent dehydratase [Legionella sp.]
MSRILVTGATGFIGKHLIPELISLGHKVIGAVRTYQEALKVEQIVVGDLEQLIDWTAFLHDVEIVIYLAAKVHVMETSLDTKNFCKVNTAPALHLAQQAAQCGVKRFIFMSSIKVNGEMTAEGSFFTEQQEAIPTDPYGKSKYLAEQQLLALSLNTTMDVVILRPSLVFGPGVKANFLKMMQLVNRGFPLPFSGINNKRTFVFIDNLISAVLAVLEDARAANQIYIVSDDESWSLPNLLACIAQNMNKNPRLFKIPGLLFLFNLLGLSQISTRLLGSLEVSNNKIKNDLGWVPPVRSADGIARTVQWFVNEIN